MMEEKGGWGGPASCEFSGEKIDASSHDVFDTVHQDMLHNTYGTVLVWPWFVERCLKRAGVGRSDGVCLLSVLWTFLLGWFGGSQASRFRSAFVFKRGGPFPGFLRVLSCRGFVCGSLHPGFLKKKCVR